ncbi:hypothetical protein Droror1_Dr00012165 [Drosera rotundifolia]
MVIWERSLMVKGIPWSLSKKDVFIYTMSTGTKKPASKVDEDLQVKLRKVNSIKKNGILLQVVQLLTDMNLVITKAYISSDGGWFMDVCHTVDYHGKKIRDKDVIDYIKKPIESDTWYTSSLRESVGVMPTEDHTSIELTGANKPGLLSDVCAVLHRPSLQCGECRDMDL